jgi:protein-S-isoprenylcysteine O-methyltransferase Ste14
VPLLAYTWPYALAFWGVWFWAFFPEFRIARKKPEPSAVGQDAGSKRLLMAGQFGGILAAFAIARLNASGLLPHRIYLFWVGLAVLVLGSLLRRHCWRMLGVSFTGDVVVRPDQVVVERGAYRYVRHPSYTAAAIMYLGIGLALGNWIGLLVLMTCVVGPFIYRVRVEERALAATIGEPYRAYMSRTMRFVPYLF